METQFFGSGASKPSARNSALLTAGFQVVVDPGDPNQLINGVAVSSIADGTNITSVNNAFGGPVTFTGTPGTGSITLSKTNAVDSTPAIVMQGNASLLTTWSPMFSGTAGNTAQVLGAPWALGPFTAYGVVSIRTVASLGAGLLVGVQGHTNAQLGLGGSAFGGNGSRLWIVGNGSALASYPSTDLALPSTPYMFVALTFNGSTTSAWLNGHNVATGGLVSTNWGAAGGIADPGFGLGGSTTSEVFGTGGGTRFLHFGIAKRELDANEMGALCSYLFSLFPSQQL